MQIKRTNVNWIYAPIKDCRKKYIMSEDMLKEFFSPATMLPIPDQVQGEVPRIIANTLNGHSILNIASTVSSFVTNYDEEYTHDWELCSEYLISRCNCVGGLIDNLTEKKTKFVGLITCLEINDIDDEGLIVLKNSILANKGEKLGDLYDISCKITYVYKEKYYINIALENGKRFDSQIEISNKEQIRHPISVTIDINDRYACQKDEKYNSMKDTLIEIIRISSDIINEKIMKLIKEGEFVYE